jgi:hypothetical protein
MWWFIAGFSTPPLIGLALFLGGLVAERFWA